jgi:P pilus assembly chaperone PapD
VVVTAENDSATRTYTVTLTRLADKSEVTTLSELSLKDVTLVPPFADSETEYTADVAKEVTSTTVTAKATHPYATVAITPGKNVNLATGDGNVIKVKVTAEDGKASETYTVTITRAEKSEISTLSGLSLSGVTLNETFFPNDRTKITYTADVLAPVSSTTVRVSKTNAQSTVVITPLDGDASAGHQVSLEAGTTTVIRIVVTPESGSADNTTTYTVTVDRAAS